MEVSCLLHGTATLPQAESLWYLLTKILRGCQRWSGHFGEDESLLPLQGFEPHIIKPIAESLCWLWYPCSHVCVCVCVCARVRACVHTRARIWVCMCGHVHQSRDVSSSGRQYRGFYHLRNKVFNLVWLAEGSEFSYTVGEDRINRTTS
jgi:hypothetical protein